MNLIHFNIYTYYLCLAGAKIENSHKFFTYWEKYNFLYKVLQKAIWAGPYRRNSNLVMLNWPFYQIRKMIPNYLWRYKRHLIVSVNDISWVYIMEFCITKFILKLHLFDMVLVLITYFRVSFCNICGVIDHILTGWDTIYVVIKLDYLLKMELL